MLALFPTRKSKKNCFMFYRCFCWHRVYLIKFNNYRHSKQVCPDVWAKFVLMPEKKFVGLLPVRCLPYRDFYDSDTADTYHCIFVIPKMKKPGTRHFKESKHQVLKPEIFMQT